MLKLLNFFMQAGRLRSRWPELQKSHATDLQTPSLINEHRAGGVASVAMGGASGSAGGPPANEHA